MARLAVFGWNGSHVDMRDPTFGVLPPDPEFTDIVSSSVFGSEATVVVGTPGGYRVTLTADVSGADPVLTSIAASVPVALSQVPVFGISGLNVALTDALQARLLDPSFFAGNDTIVGAGHDTLLGGAGDDSIDGTGGRSEIEGGAGNDTLVGHGYDTLVGGAGNDRYVLDRAQTSTITITEELGGGLDTIEASDHYRLPANVENLVVHSPGRITDDYGVGIGNDLDNVVSAFDRAVLAGGNGNDTLTGSTGNDTLLGGAGDDLLDGGGGIDTAVFASAAADYVISSVNGRTIVAARNGAPDGIDTLRGVERLQFTDRVIDLTGNAPDAPVGRSVQLLSNEVTASLLHEGLVDRYAVVLTKPSATTVTVSYSTVDGSARSGVDFVPTSGVLVFEPGEVRKEIEITGLIDGIPALMDPRRELTVHLESSDGAISADARLIMYDFGAVASPQISLTLREGEQISGATLASYLDVQGYQVSHYDTSYIFNPAGHFVTHGWGTPAEFANNAYVAGAGVDTFGLTASTADIRTSFNATFTITGIPNAKPVIHQLASQVVEAHSVAASTLFVAADVDDSIVKYQVVNANNDASGGHFVLDGAVLPVARSFEVAAAQLSQLTYHAGTTADEIWVRAWDGLAWGEWAVLNLDVSANHAPVVSAPSRVVARNSTVLLSSLVSASDPDGDSIAAYQFWDNTGGSSGRFTVGGVLQPDFDYINVSATQLASATFFTGTASDHIAVRAFDGAAWSDWVQFDLSMPVNHAPVVTASSQTIARNATLALSALVSATDPDGDTVTAYQLWDNTGGSSGRFTVGGVEQPDFAFIDVSAAQFASATFVTGTASDHIAVRAFDGAAWSDWRQFDLSMPVNHAPVVTASSRLVAKNATLALTDIFSASDPDGDVITAYQLWDNTGGSSGHFIVGGVVQPDFDYINVTPAQFASATFFTGTASDHVAVRTFDGTAWSDWLGFDLSMPVNHAPVVTAPSQTVARNATLALTDLISATDPDGDSITAYQLWDNTGGSSGHFTVGGMVQPDFDYINVTPAQLASATFFTAAASDHVAVRAFDGATWSDWLGFDLTMPVNHAPVVTASSQTIARNATLALSSLISVTDPDGDAVTAYQLWDNTGGGSGHFTVGGVAQPDFAFIDVSAAQLASATFFTGSASDHVAVRAFDGAAWTDWIQFDLSLPVNHAPVVAAPSQTVARNATLSLSSLVSASDPDGDAVTAYQLWDNTGGGSGHFTVGGMAQPDFDYINVSAAQLASATFFTGTASDHIAVRAFDGATWSDWHQFDLSVPANHAPVVTAPSQTVTSHTTVALSSLISASDPDGDAIVAYQLWDNTGGNSGRFTVGGVVQPDFDYIDVSAAQFGAATFSAGTDRDHVAVRAFDGTAWSDWQGFDVTPIGDFITGGATMSSILQQPKDNGAPIVTVDARDQAAGSTVPVASFLSAHDPDGDAVTGYLFTDGWRYLGFGADFLPWLQAAVSPSTDPAAHVSVMASDVWGLGAAVDLPVSSLSALSLMGGGNHLIFGTSTGSSVSAAPPDAIGQHDVYISDGITLVGDAAIDNPAGIVIASVLPAAVVSSTNVPITVGNGTIMTAGSVDSSTSSLTLAGDWWHPA